MGSRIKKILGYGLTDVNIYNDEVQDERINTNSILFNYKNYDNFEETLQENDSSVLENYVDFLKARYNETEMDLRSGMDFSHFKKQIKNNKTYDFGKLVTVNHEYGIPEVLIGSPAYCYDTDWYRSDDMIDYMEAGLKENPTEPYVNLFPTGIYPFSGMYVNKKDGKRIDSWKFKYLQEANENVYGGTASVQHILDEYGFDTVEDALANIVADIPEDLKALFTWSKLFTKPEYMYDLKGMLYCFWS